MFKFPFSNLHELNLDWILEQVKQFSVLIPPMETAVEDVHALQTDVEQAVTDANAAVTAANQAAETAAEALEVAEQAASGTIANGAVTTPKLANNAVTTPKILDGAVVTDKLNIGAVTSEKIADGTIQTQDIADGQITADKLASSAVTTVKILDGAVVEDKLNTGAVTETKIGSGAVTNAKIADNAVTTAKIDNETFSEIFEWEYVDIPVTWFSTDNPVMASTIIFTLSLQNKKAIALCGSAWLGSGATFIYTSTLFLDVDEQTIGLQARRQNTPSTLNENTCRVYLLTVPTTNT